MAWTTDPRSVVPEASSELAATCGEALRTLVLYGSAAGSEFDPDRSDVNLAVVLDPCESLHLRRIAQWWARWRTWRLAAPLVFSTTELERSRDVFPLEFLDLRSRHRTLAGAELFADLVIEPEAVRAECEREAKGKLFRLRGLYVELSGAALELHQLMVDSRKTFLYVIRGLLYLRGEAWITSGAAAIRAFERRYACALPVLAALGDRLRGGPIDDQFGTYLDEVALLADIADR
jgi:hypothetical protein